VGKTLQFRNLVGVVDVMNPLTLSGVTFVFILAGALVGMLLRKKVPEAHLREDAKDVVRLGAGLIGTIAALVLGLLIASAKTSFDTQVSEVKQLTADVILLDELLTHYGPEATTVRKLLRGAVDAVTDRIWQENGSVGVRKIPYEASEAGEAFIMQLRHL